jgi:hypothetical protein
MTKDIEREAFENYARSKGRYIQRSENTDKYVSMTLNEEWEAWQAAKAHEAERLKGKVVVSLDDIEKITEYLALAGCHQNNNADDENDIYGLMEKLEAARSQS